MRGSVEHGWAKCAAAVALAICITPVSACGQANTLISESMEGMPKGPVLTIGISDELPGVAWNHNGEYSGFEVSIAHGVADILGYGKEQVVFRTVSSENYQRLLHDGTVSMVVNGVKSNNVDSKEVEFSAPYLNTQDRLLVRKDTAGTAKNAVKSLQDMDGKEACVTEGNPIAQSLKTAVPGVKIQSRASYQQCVAALMVGQADAVAGIAPVLGGLAKQTGEDLVKVLDEDFGQTSLSIAVPADHTGLVVKIDDALKRMEENGAWQQAMTQMKEGTGYAVDMQTNPPRIAEPKLNKEDGAF